MKFVDAHIHLSDPDYGGKTREAVENSRMAGVVAMVSNSVDLETSRLSLKLTDEHQDLVYAALGFHPWQASQITPDMLEETISFIQENAATNKRIVAVGEVGLDPQYAKKRQQKEQQERIFGKMLQLAEELRLPAIIHSRWVAQKIMAMLPSYNLKGVLWHWLSAPVETVHKIVERGDFVSEGPPTVFSDRIQEIVKLVPLQNLLTETDGPVRYHGQPFSNRLTTSAFVPDVVKAIAKTKNIPETETAEQILRNFVTFFGTEPQ